MSWFDGFAGGAGAWTEKTVPGDQDYSVLAGWFHGHAKIGPVRQVKVTYDSEQFRIEIQVKSMKNDGPTGSRTEALVATQ